MRTVAVALGNDGGCLRGQLALLRGRMSYSRAERDVIGIDPALRQLYHAVCIVARARRWAAAAAGGASFPCRAERRDQLFAHPCARQEPRSASAAR